MTIRSTTPNLDYVAWRLLGRYARSQSPRPLGYWIELEDLLLDRLDHGQPVDVALRASVADLAVQRAKRQMAGVWSQFDCGCEDDAATARAELAP
jgi:hypothetical protein